jgi:cell division septal protein FtsQ
MSFYDDPTMVERRDITRRTRLIRENTKRIETAERQAKRLHFWLQLIGGLVVGVFVAGMITAKYASTIAHISDVTGLRDRVAVMEAKIDIILMELKK